MSNTRIQFKRTSLTVSDETLQTKELNPAEPLLIDYDTGKYLVLGPIPQTGGSLTTTVPNSIFFKGLSLKDAEHAVTYDENNILIAAPSSNPATYLKVKSVDSTQINEPSTNTDDVKYYILCQASDGSLTTFNFEDAGVYIDSRGIMHGAAWNDYAEKRNCKSDIKPGYVVCEDGEGNVELSSKRLQPCAYVVSDTYGTIIGDGNIDVAIAGKALVYVKGVIELGDCMTAGEDGYAVKMTRQEIANYPDRILGVVTEIPTYEKYQDVDVNGRVWINIK